MYFKIKYRHKNNIFLRHILYRPCHVGVIHICTNWYYLNNANTYRRHASKRIRFLCEMMVHLLTPHIGIFLTSVS